MSEVILMKIDTHNADNYIIILQLLNIIYLGIDSSSAAKSSPKKVESFLVNEAKVLLKRCHIFFFN